MVFRAFAPQFSLAIASLHGRFVLLMTGLGSGSGNRRREQHGDMNQVDRVPFNKSHFAECSKDSKTKCRASLRKAQKD